MEKHALNKTKYTKSEVEEFIKKGAKINSELSNEFIEILPRIKIENLIYDLPDGNILYVYAKNGFFTPGKANIYTKEFIINWVEYKKRIDKLFKKAGVSSVSQWLHFSQLKTDIISEKNIENLISEISSDFKIDKNKLDKTYQSLSLIDNAIKDIPKQELAEKFYDHFVAYVGEVIKNRIDGFWKIDEFDKEEKFPYISLKDVDVAYMPINVFYSCLISFEPVSLRKETANEIRRKVSYAKFQRGEYNI